MSRFSSRSSSRSYGGVAARPYRPSGRSGAPCTSRTLLREGFAANRKPPRGVCKPIVLVALVWVAHVGCATPGGTGTILLSPKITSKRAVATVSRITDATQRVKGPAATARFGDFLLRNKDIAATVLGLDSPGGGALADLATAGGVDLLAAIRPSIRRNGVESAPIWKRLHTEREGNGARIRLLGHARGLPALKVETRYSLPAKGNRMHISTQLRNQGRVPVVMEAGYVLEYGGTAPFIPGLGAATKGSRHVLRIEAHGRRSSYALMDASGVALATLERQGATLTRKLLLAPKATRTTHHSVVVGATGRSAGLAGALHTSDRVAQLDLRVLDARSEPVSSALVDISVNGHPMARLRTNEQGKSTLPLPPGEYTVRLVGPKQISPSMPAILLAGERKTIRLTAGPPSQLVYDFRPAPQEGSPQAREVHITFTGRARTPTPDFGDGHLNRLIDSDGQGLLQLPPGSYHVRATDPTSGKSIERTVLLEPLQGASIVARLP